MEVSRTFPEAFWVQDWELTARLGIENSGSFQQASSLLSMGQAMHGASLILPKHEYEVQYHDSKTPRL